MFVTAALQLSLVTVKMLASRIDDYNPGVDIDGKYQDDDEMEANEIHVHVLYM